MLNEKTGKDGEDSVSAGTSQEKADAAPERRHDGFEQESQWKPTSAQLREREKAMPPKKISRADKRRLKKAARRAARQNRRPWLASSGGWFFCGLAVALLIVIALDRREDTKAAQQQTAVPTAAAVETAAPAESGTGSSAWGSLQKLLGGSGNSVSGDSSLFDGTDTPDVFTPGSSTTDTATQQAVDNFITKAVKAIKIALRDVLSGTKSAVTS